MGPLRRWLAKITESDEARLDAEIRDWAEAVPGSVRIGDARPRQRQNRSLADNFCSSLFLRSSV